MRIVAHGFIRSVHQILKNNALLFITFLGNAQGKYQAEGTLEILDHVIHELLEAGVNLVFEVLPNQFSLRTDGK